ncbi:group II intron reverse transcriptase/maturase, partial [Streptomyces sp. MCAF7]
VRHNQHYVSHGRRAVNGTIALRVPQEVIKTKCVPYLKLGKPELRPHMVNEDDYTIISTYGAEYRGLIQYYLLAGDVFRLSRVNWVMLTSMLKTLACKYGSSVSKMADKYMATIETPHGSRRCFQASVEREGEKPLVARLGGIPLKRQKNAVLADRQLIPATARRKELISRLLSGRCEMCERAGGTEVHHVRKLADLTKMGQSRPMWAELMAKRRRKTLVVCGSCHSLIHSRQPTAVLTE